MKNPTQKVTVRTAAGPEGAEKEEGRSSDAVVEETTAVDVDAVKRPAKGRPISVGKPLAVKAGASPKAKLPGVKAPRGKAASAEIEEPETSEPESAAPEKVEKVEPEEVEPFASADDEAADANPEAAEADESKKAEAEDDYQWSDWDAEEDEGGKFARPKKIVPVFAKEETPEAATTAADSESGKPGGSRSVPRPVMVAACVVAALALAGGLYALTAMRSMTNRMDSLEATAAREMAAAEAAAAAAAETAAAIEAPAPPDSPVAETVEDVADPGGVEGIGQLGATPPTVVAGEEAEEIPMPLLEPGDWKQFAQRLDYLERRAKLTKFADEAISSGSRYAFNQLEAQFQRPGMVGLKVAANSEIIRVESIYAATTSMSYREIPTGMIDPTLKSDAEMSVPQLADILLSSSVPAEARARAAELLPRFKSFEACALLVECIRTEPNLAVLVEATRSFKDLTGYSGARVFAGPALEEWFNTNRSEIRMALRSAAAEG